ETQGTPPPNSNNNLVGGRPGAGGGAGGDGGRAAVFFSEPKLQTQTDATAGANQGGTWGGTPAATDFDEQSPLSSFSGGPGGGGGHRTAGGAGVYGSSAIAQYQVPVIGQGGAPRGAFTQFPLTSGSGGGGGGASVTRFGSCNGPFYTNNGASGGGGGGALAVVVEGSAFVGGKITADGGDGGNTFSPDCCCVPPLPCNYATNVEQGGAGGGGSGGSILIQATSDIDVVSCDSLSVLGGRGGNKFNVNGRKERTEHRGGHGSSGFIRLEAGGSALSFCGDIDVTDNVDGVTSVAVEEVGGEFETGRFRDGVLHFFFEQSIDPSTGVLLSDENGEPLSIWRYNTDSGEITRPGLSSFDTRQAGLMDVTRLLVDEGVVVRVSGSQPLTIRVRDEADIAGTIDCSGFDGGILEFSTPGDFPEPGLGGEAGPGGGAGGGGGRVEFANDAPVFSVEGEEGLLPPALAGLDPQDIVLPGSVLLGDVSPVAIGGGSRRLDPSCALAENCDSAGPTDNCDTCPGGLAGCTVCANQSSAAGGSGGGNRTAGSPGEIFPQADTDLVGAPAAAYRTTEVAGGSGGSGGGANPYVSEAYLSQLIAERRTPGVAPTRAPLLEYAFRGAARYAPGPGGGGGGGVLKMIVGTLNLRPSARLLARGGDSFQSIDLGGNGGGGGGGTIVLQVSRSVNLEEGYVIDVSGGSANRLPAITPDGLVPYESNVRGAFKNSEPVERIDGSSDFGGMGGEGGAGRVIVQMPSGVAPQLSVDGTVSHIQGRRWHILAVEEDRCRNETNISCCEDDGSLVLACPAWQTIIREGTRSLSTGPFLPSVVESVAVSKPIPLGLATTFAASSHLLDFGVPRRILSPLQPPGTEVNVYWQTASMSLDVHGGISEWQGPSTDPRQLKGREYARFLVFFRANADTRNSMAIREITLPYSLDVEN
ncbi:MAG: hypothetical protein AAF488_15735, partial [Planctomycetota bacterium]